MKKQYLSPQAHCFGNSDPDVCTISRVTLDLGDGYDFSRLGAGDEVKMNVVP